MLSRSDSVNFESLVVCDQRQGVGKDPEQCGQGRALESMTKCGMKVAGYRKVVELNEVNPGHSFDARACGP